MVCAAVLLSINETRVLDVSAQYGGPFATLARPLIIVLTFIIWACIAFEDTMILLSNQYSFYGITISFILIVIGNISIAKYSHFAKKRPIPSFANCCFRCIDRDPY